MSLMSRADPTRQRPIGGERRNNIENALLPSKALLDIRCLRRYHVKFGLMSL
jgi:hypothetical protein